MRASARTLRAGAAATAIVRGLARRLVVSLSAAAGRWNFRGYKDGALEESFAGVEVFQGIGFISRPAAGGRPEAIVLQLGGGTGHPVAVATRDRRLTLAIDEDETAILNSTGALVRITKDGDIVVTAAAGRTVSIDDGSGAAALAPQAEITSLKSVFDGWTPVLYDGGAALKTALASWTPAGTTVLKGK
jgi:phage gp45-like